LVAGGAHGSLAFNANGSFAYPPAADFNGTDSFTYKASDGQLAGNTATVTLTVRPVNDAPVARDDAYATDEDTPLVVGPQPGQTFLFLNSQPGDFVGQGQRTTLTPADGQFTAGRNFDNGVSISFFSSANPGIFWFTDFAAPFNAVLTPGFYANATRFPFQAANEPGLDVSGEGRGSNTLTGNFTVTQAVYGPAGEVVAFDATFEQHSEGSPPALFGQIAFNATPASNGVLLNDSAVDGDPLHAVLVSGPLHGRLTLNANGTLNYTPDPDYNGTDSFTYQAFDGTARSNVATVTITVRPVNDA